MQPDNWQPPTPHRRSPLSALLLAVLVIGLIGAAAVGGYLYRDKLSASLPAPTPTPSPAPSVDSLTDSFNAPYALPDGRRADSPVVAKLAVPVKFRVQVDSRPDCNLAVALSCRSYTLANALGSPTSLSGSNSITLYSLRDWLTVKSAPAQAAPAFANLTDPPTKLAAFDSVQTLTKDSILTPEKIKAGTLLNPFITNAIFSGLSYINQIKNADGSLIGYSFIASLQQGPGYNPHAYSVLTGKVGDTPVVVMGDFVINDALRTAYPTKYPSVVQVNQFAETYTDGYKYAPETLSQADEASKIVTSLTLGTHQ